MALREEIDGNQQAKNPRKAEAATNREVFIEGGESAGCGADPEACEEVVSPSPIGWLGGPAEQLAGVVRFDVEVQSCAACPIGDSSVRTGSAAPRFSLRLLQERCSDKNEHRRRQRAWDQNTSCVSPSCMALISRSSQ
jgi:hypothetical protein